MSYTENYNTSYTEKLKEFVFTEIFCSREISALLFTNNVFSNSTILISVREQLKYVINY